MAAIDSLGNQRTVTWSPFHIPASSPAFLYLVTHLLGRFQVSLLTVTAAVPALLGYPPNSEGRTRRLTDFSFHHSVTCPLQFVPLPES